MSARVNGMNGERRSFRQGITYCFCPSTDRTNPVRNPPGDRRCRFDVESGFLFKQFVVEHDLAGQVWKLDSRPAKTDEVAGSILKCRADSFSAPKSPGYDEHEMGKVPSNLPACLKKKALTSGGPGRRAASWG